MAVRIAGAKLSAMDEIGLATFAAVGAPPAPVEASAIGPREGLGALEQRAASLMRDTSALGRKAFLIRRELRSIGEIITRPLDDLKL